MDATKAQVKLATKRMMIKHSKAIAKLAKIQTDYRGQLRPLRLRLTGRQKVRRETRLLRRALRRGELL